MRRLVATLAGLAVVAPAAAAGGPDPEAARFAEAAAIADREVVARSAVVGRRLAQVGREYAQCPVVDTLRGARLALAYDAMSLRYVHAVFDPIAAALDRFVARLSSPAATDAILAAGARGWRTVASRSAALPRGPRHICLALGRWKRSGFAASAVPISATDRARQRAYVRARTTAIERIDRAAARLRARGVDAEGA